MCSFEEFENEREMLKGNIARICITDDYGELPVQEKAAIKRIKALCRMKKAKLMGLETEENKNG